MNKSRFGELESEAFLMQSKKLIDSFEKHESNDLDFLSSVMDNLDRYEDLQYYVEKDPQRVKIIAIQ